MNATDEAAGDSAAAEAQGTLANEQAQNDAALAGKRANSDEAERNAALTDEQIESTKASKKVRAKKGRKKDTPKK